MSSLAVLAVTTPVACALAPRFAAPEVVGQASGQAAPSILVGPVGDVGLVWVKDHTLVESTRAAAGGSWSTPADVLSIDADTAKVMRNDAGAFAAVFPNTPWLGDATLKAAVATPGSPFSDPEPVPLPEPLPPEPGRENSTTGQTIIGPTSVLTPDGTLVVGYQEQDGRSGAMRAAVAVRPPGGPFEPAQVLGEG